MITALLAHVPSSDLPLQEVTDSVQAAGIVEAQEAGWVMLLAILMIVALWYGISRTPRPKKAVTLLQQITLARWIGCIMVIAVASVSWDTWWHRAIGRDTIWVAPHLALYSAALLCILGSLYGWYLTRDRRWKLVALAVLLIPIGAPFDQLWHTFFGVEDLTRPIALIWAPPHLMIEFASAFTFLCLLPILYHDTVKDLRNLMGMIIFGTLTGTALFIFLPLHPTEGFGQAIGFFGALPISMVLVAIPLIGRAWMRDKVGALKIMLVTVAMCMTAYTQEQAPHVIMLPHDTMPNWIIIFTDIITAIWLDWSDRYPLSIRGLIAGIFAAGFMFGIARFFFDPQFFYGTSSLLLAMLLGGIGGLIGADIAKRTIRTFGLDEKF